jgi:hypothetical protein
MAQSITTSQKEAEQLLQAILREAFTEHASKYQIEETLA